VQKHVALPQAKLPVERLWRIVAKRALLATGAEERPLVFGGNDKPGVMMAGAMRTYANRFGVVAGKSVAIFTNGSAGYRTAADLVAHGVGIAAIIDSRTDVSDVAPDGVRVIQSASVIDTKGRQRVSGAVVERSGFEQTIACDAIGMSGGWNPVIHLACQRGAKAIWSEDLKTFLAPDVGNGLVVAGAAAGRYSLAGCLKDGADKAAIIVADLGFSAATHTTPVVDGEVDPSFTALWYAPGAKARPLSISRTTCMSRISGLRCREGFGHVEHAKRYTTNGMATDQGKLSGINATAFWPPCRASARPMSAQRLSGRSIRRSPFGALAGTSRDEHAAPVRKSPLHGWAQKKRRCLRRFRPLVPAGLFFAVAKRPGAKARPRSAQCPGECRSLRCLDARQDRDFRAGRRGIPQPPLLQSIPEAAGRQGALWADAARGRHGL
jgi:hypothetical protein